MLVGRYSALVCGTLVLALFGCLSVKWYERASASTDDSLAAEKAARYAGNATNAYGVMIDCGSSGSRVFVFTWKMAYVPETLLQISEVNSTNVRPGLSSFDGASVKSIEEYIRPLVQFAASFVPRNQHRDTPIYLMCTAGMRKLSDSGQQYILNAVRAFIRKNYTFDFEDYYAEVISGKQEAIFSWITANYLLDQFKSLSSLSKTNTSACDDANLVCFDENGEFVTLDSYALCKGRSSGSTGGKFNMTGKSSRIGKKPADWERRRCRLRSFGMVEMGGASMQIAFELSPLAVNTFREAGALQPESDENSYTVDLNLGCTEDSAMKYRVYVTTYLNYGANSARDRYHLSYFKSPSQTSFVGTDPCLPKGHNYTKVFTSLDLQPYASSAYGLNIDVNVNKTVFFTGTANYNQCLKRINDSVMNIKCTPCSANPRSKRNHCQMTDNCTILAYWQPTIAFDQQPFYAFSDFYYRYTDLYGLTGIYNESLFRTNNEAYCSKAFAQLEVDYNRTISVWKKDSRKGPGFAKSQLEAQCFQALYDYAVLHYAFKFPREFQNLMPAGEIRGSQLQWTLGAMLYKTRHFPLRYKTGEVSIISSGHKVSGRYKEMARCSMFEQETNSTESTGCTLLPVADAIEGQVSWFVKHTDVVILAAFFLCCLLVGLVTYVLVGIAKRRQSRKLRSPVVDSDCRQVRDQQQPLSIA